ncbi:MAG: exodeoxyribonuclease V subunit alpha [Gammaproteobacteria bacterium]|jgi:exodeoxyribonuclease V alpha subunit|nr:exodeoxyribonuclease V subunit alpha [Gammaproteobacteria bacterium]MBK7519228.1 exodeoxyribonuclease V subunit alpha [Gammaproteobacteria bacterium]MBK7730032.1 exodeoxyribonuclease V subunit alpha [Gammaproteobacteria bacterium]
MITREGLRALQAEGLIRAIDYHFGCALARHAVAEPEAIAIAGALCSIALGNGDVCVDLGAVDGKPFAALGEALDVAALRAALAREPAICAHGGAMASCPLVLDGDRLYLQRYWQSEQRVAARLLELAARAHLPGDETRELLGRLFGEDSPGAGGQKLACIVALTRGFAVITGGPGTGKTTTVARLLVLLAAAARDAGKSLVMRLAAPTGKAAARVGESLAREVAAMRAAGTVEQALLERLPQGAETLHRLLGAGSNGFRHDAQNPLPADLVVLDESSMIDLRLLDALLLALPAHARLVMLGDSEQLDAVEAGSVFGALCTGSGRYSAARAREIEALAGCVVATEEACSPVQDTIALLGHSYRFDAGGGIGRLAAAVNAGDGERANALLDSADPAIARTVYGEHLGDSQMAAIRAGYTELLGALRAGADAQQLLALQERFRVLCALREGEFGVAGLNRAIERTLASAGLIDDSTPFYAGRPLLVTRNDHGLRLYNGDLGLVVPGLEGHHEVLFRAPDGSARRLPPGRLPDHETAFAMTVHKSQGSEFDEICLVLPPPSSAPGLAGREMLYTAITRARRRVLFILPEARLEERWFTATKRVSGLRERLTRPECRDARV